MCIGGGGSTPAVPPPAPPPPEAPTATSDVIQNASGTQNARARAAAGLSSTILTGPMGLSAPATSMPKTLLGA